MSFSASIKKGLLFFLIRPVIAQTLFHPLPHVVIPNIAPSYSLINSVDFHPKEPIFCVTYTHNNKVSLYKLNPDLHPFLIQTLQGSQANLKEPQHAVFSPDGEKLVVANWTDRTLNVYLRGKNSLFDQRPISSTLFPKALDQSKPHGIAFSPTGQYLAVACGATSDFKNGLALFKCFRHDLKPVSILTHTQLLGTPKGICFSPDGTCLLVTFCEPSTLAIFHLDGEKIDPIPQQIIEGPHTQLSRPEDIKLSPDGTYCAVSNSDQNSVTFYHFDKTTNAIIDSRPFWSLQNPEANLSFPHGLAFSSDGTCLVITQFGKIQMTKEGKIIWHKEFSSQEGTVNIYRSNQQEETY